MMKNSEQFNCPMEITIALIGGKYKAIILWHLIGKTLRFTELRRLVPTATQKMLTQQLRMLEEDKLINRTVYPVVPPKVEYSLTGLGESLIPALTTLCDWGETYQHSLGITPCCKKLEQQKTAKLG